MITIKITLQYLPKTGKLLFDADVIGQRSQINGKEFTALEAPMPHLKQGFLAIKQASGDRTATLFDGKGEIGAMAATALHEARLQAERDA